MRYKVFLDCKIVDDKGKSKCIISKLLGKIICDDNANCIDDAFYFVGFVSGDIRVIERGST